MSVKDKQVSTDSICKTASWLFQRMLSILPPETFLPALSSARGCFHMMHRCSDTFASHMNVETDRTKNVVANWRQDFHINGLNSNADTDRAVAAKVGILAIHDRTLSWITTWGKLKNESAF